MAEARSPLQSVANFRDVGQFCNDSLGTRLSTGIAARLITSQQAQDWFVVPQCSAWQRLVKDFGIKAIIDLRTKTEHIQQAQKHGARVQASAAVPKTTDQVAEPIKLPGIHYHQINFNGSAFSRMLISKLTWLEFFRLIGLMVLGYRTDAIRVLAPYMEDMGLVGLATQSLDVCTHEVAQVFQVLAQPESWPLLVHCTQGKDRTGLVILLVLLLLNVDPEVVKKDYELSESELASEMDERLHEISAIGLSRQFALCPSDLVPSVYSHILDKYGSVEQYLDQAGVAKEHMDFVKRNLSADVS
ncbi:hypothetical protein yc1106_02599 [Curvularia clavata]|uniref:Tyrosine specific protein phosphatases domain-containing protein n=1 Tax=Curvularia clavata TaxID=95742 RepID=A0A9Q9DQQ9_CURCL|nr:hypothetical protein yc1106_02599 [Curvularia clavata]